MADNTINTSLDPITQKNISQYVSKQRTVAQQHEVQNERTQTEKKVNDDRATNPIQTPTEQHLSDYLKFVAQKYNLVYGDFDSTQNNASMQMSIDRRINRIVTKIFDKTTNDLIRQIPPEEEIKVKQMIDNAMKNWMSERQYDSDGQIKTPSGAIFDDYV